MSAIKEWFVRDEEGRVYGPADLETLTAWAKDGRVEPTGFVSKDRINWMPAQMMGELEMKWLVETEPGKVFGPFNRQLVVALFAKQSIPGAAKVYRLHEFPVAEDPPPVVKVVEVEKVVEKIVEKEVRVEVPVEKIVEKEVIKEVPVEVEKIVEKIVEVEPPARTEIVVPEIVEPVDAAPPIQSPGKIFGNLDRKGLAALEQAAQRELAKGKRFGFGGGFFGRKNG